MCDTSPAVCEWNGKKIEMAIVEKIKADAHLLIGLIDETALLTLAAD